MSNLTGEIFAAVWVIFVIGYTLVGGFFARLRLRRGRSDVKGALRHRKAV